MIRGTFIVLRVLVGALMAIFIQNVLADNEHALTLIVHNLESNGEGVFALYDSAAAYDERQPLLTGSSRVSDGRCSWTTPSLKAGRYMVSFYHDVNGNGRLDRTAIGIPREPVAFSNNARPRFGPPRFEKMVFEHSDSGEALELEAFRALGKRGRFGLGVGGIVNENPYDSDGARSLFIPMITYMGDRLSITGPMVRYLVATPSAFTFSLYCRYSFEGFDVDDSDRLDDMHDRDDTVMGGVALNWEPWKDIEIGLDVESDLLGEHDGQRAEVALGYTFRIADVAIIPGIGFEWLSEDTADHLYGVKASEATGVRPYYRPGASLSPNVKLGARYSLTDSIAAFASAGWTLFDDAIQDSPIVVKDDVFSVFLAVAYSL